MAAAPPTATLTTEGRTRLARALGQQGQTVQVAKVHFLSADGTKVYENTPALVGHEGSNAVVLAATLDASVGDFAFSQLAFYTGDTPPVRLLDVSVQPFNKAAGGLAFAQLVRIEYTNAASALGSTQPAPPWLLTGDNALAHVQTLHTRTLHPYESTASAINVQAGLDLKTNCLLNASIDASLIDGGVLATGRIPSLAASKIASGVLDALRIPALAAGKIASGVLALARLPRISTEKGGMPSGAVQSFAGANAPTGWLVCDGALVSRTTYADLFAAIGVGYGAGDATTTFALPDLRGRVPIGAGEGIGLDIRVLGAKGGEEKHTLTAEELPTAPVKLPSRQHLNQQTEAWDNRFGVEAATGNQATQNILIGAPIYYPKGQIEGSDEKHNNMQPFLALNYIIKT